MAVGRGGYLSGSRLAASFVPLGEVTTAKRFPEGRPSSETEVFEERLLTATVWPVASKR